MSNIYPSINKEIHKEEIEKLEHLIFRRVYLFYCKQNGIDGQRDFCHATSQNRYSEPITETKMSRILNHYSSPTLDTVLSLCEIRGINYGEYVKKIATAYHYVAQYSKATEQPFKADDLETAEEISDILDTIGDRKLDPVQIKELISVKKQFRSLHTLLRGK